MSLQCKAIGMPKPVVTWEKAFSNLPIGRTAVIDGSLKISNIAKVDSGAYACSAKNRLGKVGTLSRVIKVYQEMYKKGHVYPCRAT